MQSQSFWITGDESNEGKKSEYLLSPEDLGRFSPRSTVLLSFSVFGVVNLCKQIDYQPRYFQNVVLVSCFSDSYGPFDSARVMNSAFPTICPTEIPTEIIGKKTEVEIGNMLGMHTAQEAYKEIVQNLWKNVTQIKRNGNRGILRSTQPDIFQVDFFFVWCPKVRVTPIEQTHRFFFLMMESQETYRLIF